LATAFGAGALVDAYLVALTVPFLLNTSIVSTLEASFVPVYLSCKTETGLARATAFAESAHLWLFVGGTLLMAGAYGAMPALLSRQAPGFSTDQLTLARHLYVWIAPSIVFAGLYALGRSVLNAEQRFLWPALAPAIGAAVTTAVILLGRRALGIDAAAIGYTAGTAALWLTVYVPLTIAKLPGRGLFASWRNPDVWRLFRIAGPLCVGVVATAGVAVVDRLMASRFPAGVIAGLSYADRIVQIPVTILATAVTTAAFPALSVFAANHDFAGIRRTLAAGIELLAMTLVPVAVLIIVFRRDIVAVVFERGQFRASDVEMVATLLSGLAIGLAFMGTFQLIPRVFNALQMAPFVALSGLLNLGFKTLFNLFLVPAFGYIGFAVATSAMYIATGFTMLWLLRRTLGRLNLSDTIPTLTATLVGSVVLGVLGTGLAAFLKATGPFNRLIVAGGLACALYLATLWLLTGRALLMRKPDPYTTTSV
jgi:putative peptidoglycan lipid II flippase